jgi:hypothetical protein
MDERKPHAERLLAQVTQGLHVLEDCGSFLSAGQASAPLGIAGTQSGCRWNEALTGSPSSDGRFAEDISERGDSVLHAREYEARQMRQELRIRGGSFQCLPAA